MSGIFLDRPRACGCSSRQSQRGKALERKHILIAGAGSIGCFVGALLASGGHQVTLLGRPRVLDQIRTQGLTAKDFAGLCAKVPASDLTLSDDPSCLADTDLILVTVKSAATKSIALEIAAHAPPSVPVISLQNGLDSVDTLRAALPGRDIRAGMVPFNVVPENPATYHRASSGDIVIASGPGDLAAILCVPGLVTTENADIVSVQWGKLLLNLNNAINALSGLTLLDQLTDRAWRRLMADQMVEALAVLKAAGIPVASTTPLPAWMGPHILRLPTPLFTRIAAQMLIIDPSARTSMSYDVAAGRPTEIDSFQGAILQLADRHGIAAPLVRSIADHIRSVTDKKVTNSAFQPDQLRPGSS